MSRMRYALLAVVAALVWALTASPAQAAKTVVIDSVDTPASVFQPANVTVEVGDTVRWEFDQASTTHTVKSQGANWAQPIDELRGPNGAPINRTFTTPGTYNFLCDVHTGMTGSVTVQAPKLERVLVFSKTGGFRHDSIPQGVAAIQALGTANGFTVVATEDAAQFTAANLATFDVVVFMSTTGEILNAAQQTAFEDYIKAGGGFAGVHAASDTEYEWPWFGELVGGYFRSHPPGTPTADVKIEDGDEPSTTGLPATWTRTDEWYNFQHPTTPVINGNTSVADYSPRARHVKVLATVDEATYDEQDGNTENDDHPIAWCSNFDGGRSWYTGMGHTQASFSDAQFRAHLLGGLRTAAGVAGDCGEPRSMPPTADDFEKITINNDTNAPMEIDIANDGRAFYIELDGRVQMWNPTTRTTTMVGDLRNAVTLSHENGLLGIQLAKDFDTSGHIYLAYSALPDAAGINRVSRFTLTGNTLGQEQIIYTWQHQRQECCHTGGSLEWGANGDLYISTGDNTNPFAHGFNPTDERAGRQIWDAQRTSGNTNDPNGKILRIRPIPNATGTPGVGTTYTIPSGNLFPVGTAQTLPEIYAMGFRNPFRINYDPKTGWITMGDYGPDAGSTDANRGPQGSVEWNVVKGPGNYGWPYCIRQNVAYKDITYTSNAGGTVKGDYSCTAPVNDSPNNTGLTNLPPAIPATMWTGYSELDTRFPDIGGGGAPTGGPIYRYNEASTSDRKFPKFFDGQLFMGEWNNDWIKTATLNDQGLATGVSNWAVTTGYISPMDIEFGPDGSLYVVEWGQGFAENNPDSGVYRIDYISGARTPIANAAVDNDAVPVGTTVQFSSAGSNDPDGTQISYLWNFGDGTPTSTAPNPSHQYTAAGTYNATLTVTDESGASAVDTVTIVVGNQRPVVTIEVPENGKVADFGDKVHYKVSVTDPDGGSTGAGTIACSDIRIEVKLGHDSHAHELFTPTGCEGDFVVTSVDGHGVNANVFTVITAAYTDKGNGPAQGVTGSAEAILQPKLKQAEYYATTGRTADGRGTGDPGVTQETTTDVNGGNAAAFIEDGDWISFNPYNLEDLTDVTFRVASGGAGGIIELRYDAADGPLVAATPLIAPTGGWQTWQDVKLALPATIPQGTHRLFIVFRHPTNTGSLMNLNWFKFAGKGGAVTAPPVIEAKAEPVSGVAPLNVAFDVDATDPEGGALTYAWDFGVPGTEADKSTQKSPNYTYTAPGNYTASVTVSDPDGGHATDTVEVRVTRPLDECPTGPVRSDEFDGTTLDSKWTVDRPDAANPLSVSGGSLNLPIAPGSMYANGTTAKNVVVQSMPDGEWSATAKISATALSENYHQAGLRVWAGDDNWASVHMIHAGGNRDFEFITEVNGNPRNEGADKLGGIPPESPLDYYVRIISDGENLTAEYSFNGTTFLPVGRPVSLATFADPKIGPAALSAEAPTVPVARFDWIHFEPDGSGGGGNEGIVDNFDGTTLDAAWDRIRPDQSAVVGSGTLQIPAQAGDLYQGRNDAKNLIVRTAPSGAWQAITKMNFKGTTQYHQAGILVYGDDNNFVKFGRIAHSTAGAEKFEYINEVNAVARNEAVDSTANLAAGFPNDYYLRLTSDGTNVVGHYSTDGTTWTPVGRSAVIPANAKIGLFAFADNGAGNPVAAFDSFTLTGDQVGGGGGGGGGTPSGPSYDDQFDGATLDKTRWNAIVRDTPAEYGLAGGEFNLILGPGDIYTGDSVPPPNNFILQDASHAGADWVIETKINDYTHDGGYAQGGLLAYLDGDNYVKLDAITDVDNTRVNRIELRSEIAGVIQQPESNAPVTAAQAGGPFWLRLTKVGTTYKGEYSFDGIAWTATPNSTVNNPMAAPDFGLFGFSPQAPGVGDTVSFDYFTLDGPDPSSCEQCDGPGDSFDGTALDADRWNGIEKDNPAKYSVADGALKVTTTLGEIYQTGTGGGPLLLQSADHAGTDWELETKFTHTLDGGYSQGGILAYGSDNDYVKINAISDDGNARINRLELRSEVGGTVSATPSDPQVTAAQSAGPIWLKLTKAGNTYTGHYKFSETGEWQTFSGTVTNAMVAPKFGLYTQGVLQENDTVTFEYFSVDGDSTGCPPTDENTPPTIESATATPTSGFAPLDVKFDVTATDEDDDALTYAWDFDGNGSTDSTSEDPTHTYTTAGVYEAKVTVSDGEDTRTRTVTITVFGADDPEARFRVLVFSKTTGFRHDSIPAGIAAIRSLGEANDFQVDASEDAGVFNATTLARYDAVVFMSTTGDPLNAAQQTAFESYIRGGGGYVGVHAAADTEYEWPFYGQLVGAYFQSHPAGTPTATVRVDDPNHHSTTGLPNPWSRVDEWYNYQSPTNPVVGGGGADYSPRGKVHVLLTVDETTYEEGDGNTTDDDHPISWCQRYEGGRSWYTGMGHTQASFSEPDFRKHLLGGLEVASGVVQDANCGKESGNRPPTVNAFRTPAGDVSIGDPIEFKAEGTDPDGDTLTYEWEFGDGGTANTATAIHSYSTAGVWYAKVTVRDGKGGKTEALLQVAVKPESDNDEQVGVGGVVSGVMSLEIAGSANLGVFIPGVAKDYMATLAATATSTASAAELTVHDNSATATGRLVNGTHALASPVQVNADGGSYVPVGGPAPPRARVAKWVGPFSGKTTTIGFKQSIAANEQLLTGGYGKVLTFTLSPTTP